MDPLLIIKHVRKFTEKNIQSNPAETKMILAMTFSADVQFLAVCFCLFFEHFYQTFAHLPSDGCIF